jgi:hypothetical protein
MRNKACSQQHFSSYRIVAKYFKFVFYLEAFIKNHLKNSYNKKKKTKKNIKKQTAAQFASIVYCATKTGIDDRDIMTNEANGLAIFRRWRPNQRISMPRITSWWKCSLSGILTDFPLRSLRRMEKVISNTGQKKTRSMLKGATDEFLLSRIIPIHVIICPIVYAPASPKNSFPNGKLKMRTPDIHAIPPKHIFTINSSPTLADIDARPSSIIELTPSANPCNPSIRLIEWQNAPDINIVNSAAKTGTVRKKSSAEILV